MSHINNGNCLACAQILNKYPGFNEELRTWFQAIQIEHVDIHTSCGGRGRVDQSVLFQRGATKANYGQSAHNFNCALDLFRSPNGDYILDQEFEEIIQSAIYPSLSWYGAPGAVFRELPHIELKNWNSLAHQGIIKLVE